MHLVSLRPQHIVMPGASLDFTMAKGETIWTESSYQFQPDQIRLMLERCGFAVTHQWVDHPDLFGLTRCVGISPRTLDSQSSPLSPDSLLAPRRHDAVRARVRNRLAEMLVLIHDQYQHRALFRHVLPEHLDAGVQVRARETSDRLLQCRVGTGEGLLELRGIRDCRSAHPAALSCRTGQQAG